MRRLCWCWALCLLIIIAILTGCGKEGNETMSETESRHLETETVGTDPKDLEAARSVEDLIDELRFAYAVIDSDEPSVKAAREAFDKLTQTQKDLVDPERLAKLEADEERLLHREPELKILVTDAPYNAKADGVTNDRAAIQKAIDDASEAGGGMVIIPAGKTVCTANLMLLSGVHLKIEEGAVLLQTGDADAFVNPLKKFEPHELKLGQYVDSNIEWDATAYYNFPFLYARNAEDIAISGPGTIRLTGGNDPRGLITMQAIAMVEVNRYVVSDVKLIGYQAYCIKNVSCQNGLYHNVRIDASESIRGGTDGISLGNCRNMRVTGCNLLTGDDGIYVCSAWSDPREGLYYTNDNPQTPENIEIDHNHCELTWDATKAFCFIVWGSQYPDQEKIQVNNIYVHDNYFQTLGAWTGNWDLQTHLFDFNGSTNPMKNIRFENNEIGQIQDNFYTLPVSDFYGFDSMRSVRNGDFEQGDIYWVSRLKGSRASAGASVSSAGQNGKGYGFISDLEKGDAALYEGLFLDGDTDFEMKVSVKTSGDRVRLFVRDQITQELIASLPLTNLEWQQVSLTFRVPSSGNYQLGIERGEAAGGYAYIDDFSLATVTYPNDTILTYEKPDRILEGQKGDFGLCFTPVMGGQVTQVRLYVPAGDDGVHTVKILDGTTGELLAGPFDWNITAGSADGWQVFKLPKALSVKTGKTYILTVSTTERGLLPVSEGLFEKGLERPFGTVSEKGGRKENTATADCYFRDVVIDPGFESLLDDFVPDGTGSCQLQDVLGIKFIAESDGTIPMVRMYCLPEISGIHVITLWDYQTKKCIGGPYEWDVKAGQTGWQYFMLPEPVRLEYGKTYALGISVGPNCMYVKGTDQLTESYEEEHIRFLPNASLYSGNYNSGLAQMPGNTANGGGSSSNNYFRDICFVPDD
ncbi:MAG: DUF4082 domain-containing protein [Clostridia bacterium]|nr:DUF4082 domain-containing protein [Clostridia bacterium]